MALCSLFGGIALANAKLGAVHGVAGVVGGMVDAPHGAVCAALLAPVVEANLQALREREPCSPGLRRYAEVAEKAARSSSMQGNPVRLTEEELVTVFHAAS